MARSRLTLGERQEIETGIGRRLSLGAIAKSLGRSVSTVSREIRNHSSASTRTGPYSVHNACRLRYACTLSMLCIGNPDCSKPKCRKCRLCNSVCGEFEEEKCPDLERPPHVCNGCGRQHKCTLNRRYYNHRDADRQYRATLSESRSGANLTEEGRLHLDGLITPYLKKGQSVHAFYVNSADQVTVCERTLYNYVDGGLFKGRNIDMPRKMRMKPRRKPVPCKVDKRCREGRGYDSFKEFQAGNPCVPIVEMDTVQGCAGSTKVLLTLQLTNCDLMLAFLRDRNTSQSVIDAFNAIQARVGLETFGRMFKVILTDNGTEFSNPKALEHDVEGNRRASVYYCEPYSFWQKPRVELNHEFIRRILPKGSSFDHLAQGDIDLMMSHVNSYVRGNLNDRTPYDIFCFLYGEDVLNSLGIFLVDPADVCLRPSLLPRPPKAEPETEGGRGDAADGE
jgi:IS30 family transposase